MKQSFLWGNLNSGLISCMILSARVDMNQSKHPKFGCYGHFGVFRLFGGLNLWPLTPALR